MNAKITARTFRTDLFETHSRQILRYLDIFTRFKNNKYVVKTTCSQIGHQNNEVMKV